MNLNELSNDKISIVVAGENVEINAADSVKDTLKWLFRWRSFAFGHICFLDKNRCLGVCLKAASSLLGKHSSVN